VSAHVPGVLRHTWGEGMSNRGTEKNLNEWDLLSSHQFINVGSDPLFLQLCLPTSIHCLHQT
jgi:hypothetical protein